MKASTESKTTASRQNKSKRKKKMEMRIVLHYSFSEDINTNLSPHTWRQYCGDISFSEV
jgi:hypothetical protein